MTRRAFIGAAMSAAVLTTGPRRLTVPIFRIVDARAQIPAENLRRFWNTIWPEATRDFSRGGIDLLATDGPGEIRMSPGDKPVFVGLRRGIVNLVVTGRIPMYWDNGLGWGGVTTIYQGYHICLIALRYAHGDQAPFLSVNTCVHELLHALLQDIFLKPPKWYRAGEREFQIDWYATRLWLFHEGGAVRKSGEAYLDRLRSAAAAHAESH
jgi:hypothetical protein